jgi:hypothetical protein
MLGTLSAGVARMVPDLPRCVALPLGVGAWINANGFGLLAHRPQLTPRPAFQKAAVASFAATSWGFTAAAVIAWRRRDR